MRGIFVELTFERYQFPEVKLSLQKITVSQLISSGKAYDISVSDRPLKTE